MVERPTHVCIGLARSGTTWLFEALSKTPELFLPPAKEVRYWYGAPAKSARRAHVDFLEQTKCLSDKDRSWLKAWIDADTSNVSGENYRMLMDTRGVPSLDISPSYAAMPLEYIKNFKEELSEKSKVFVLLRNPYERLRSEVKLHGFLHGKFRGQPTNAIISRHLDIPQFGHNRNYTKIVSHWREVFGDRFKVFYYEDLIADKASFLNSVLEFIDFDEPERVSFRSEDLTAFVATDRNNPNGKIYPRLTREQDRIIADRVSPEVDAFSAIEPERSKMWDKNIAREIESLPPSPALDISCDTDYQTLLRMTESLGDNCEFGFVQRFENYEPSSLFRWAFCPTDRLVNYLEHPQPLFEKEALRLVDSDLVLDCNSGISFHSDLIIGSGADRRFVGQEDFDNIWKKEKEKIDHFSYKFWHFSQSRPGIYVLKNNSGITEDQISRIEAVLLSKNPNHKLLHVSLGETAAIESIKGACINATIPHFANYLSANKVDMESWRKIMRRILDLDDVMHMVRTAFV